MFVWKTSVILRAFEAHLPDVYRETEKLMQSKATDEQVGDFYRACPSVSIDYGIMEKAEKVEVLPGDFDWNDVGSWTAVHELSDKDENENATGKSLTSIHNTRSSLVHSESGKLIALVGVEDIALVETENAILVVNLKKAQGVKDVVDDLKSDPEKSQYL
jgi:mannose-1-phosphate guanylyltransferase